MREMFKDFWKWHKKKEQINNIAEAPLFHEREIWFCHLGNNVGTEEDGSGKDFLRPILILRKYNKDALTVVPLTRRRKDTEHYYSFETSDGKSTAILSQTRLVDARRLSYLVSTINKEDFQALKEKLRVLLKL